MINVSGLGGKCLKITYLYHSGFSVELETCVLLFDYYRGTLPVWEKEKPVYVFVSHKHKDHFNMEIFGLAERYGQVHFFLGSDIKLSEKYLERNGVPASVKSRITNVGKNKTLEFSEELTVRTLRSTDAGVAFVVRVQGRLFYHAGDLNWWHWEGEPAPFNENMERDYKKEMDAIRGLFFDAAFVPLDPRLESAYGWGMDYFLMQAQAAHVFPMHMWEEYGIIDRYKKTPMGTKYGGLIADIREAGQKFTV